MKKFLLLVSLYLLGSARGASGQSDRLPGSMDHQASVQQPSGDYFSLANSSDGEALYETSSGENTLSEHGSSEHTAVEHASGEHDAVEHASGEHATVKDASSEHASSGQPSGEQPSGEKPSGEQPTGEQVASEKPSGEQPAGEQVSAEQVSGEKSPGKQPSGPVLNCHTCSYMNDQGKCLRGEGVCSTQDSQQCMLKKIFEGGKLQFIVQDCENMCPSMNLFSHGTRMQLICCRNQSFCNKV
ncbi:acrosomal protein SP-10 isoform X2 [Physeter macrocephalus]|uniref:Acrosomal protein SP-10 isoform X2 n=1 Tax=Physeter macrocephalus TaxID=9755 RepID=A0A2Y9FKH0_PHYMC|nr:acrosomal protein SP-10 isoform X2 [Physeter catodon]|eukprot:XP_007123784.1 acrosomal protein SP-10 isoform X2 [Physeter catodon]